MLDPALLPYVAVALIICLTALTIILVPAMSRFLKGINEILEIGGDEDRPCYDPDNIPSNPLEDEGEAYLNRRPL